MKRKNNVEGDFYFTGGNFYFSVLQRGAVNGKKRDGRPVLYGTDKFHELNAFLTCLKGADAVAPAPF